MKKLLYLFLLISTSILGQSPSVYFQTGAQISLTNGSYVYVQDGTTTAIQSAGTSGFYVPDNGLGYVEWNTQSNTGNYTIPFVSTSGSNVPVNISITSTTNPGTLKASNVDVSAGFPIWKDANSINRYWTIDFSGYSTLPSGTVTVNYLTSDVPVFFPLLVTKYYNTNTWQWTNNELATINYTTKTSTLPINSYLQTNNAYHTWSLINPISALPITLVNLYTISVENKFIDVVWQTSTEINNLGFIVQRSIDGSNFDSIGWVNGNGNSTQTQYYQFYDYTVFPNILYYYRLKQIDNNGNYTYSFIKSGKIYDDFISVSNFMPNPSISSSRIIINTMTPKTVYIKIYDIIGRQVGDQTLQTTQFQNSISFDTQELSPSTYIFIISIDNINYTRKLIIQN